MARQHITFLVLIVTFTAGDTLAQSTPGYNNKITAKFMTPDRVETRIGTLKFFDEIPTKETAALLDDNLDFIRGVETFLTRVPAVSRASE